MKKVYITHGHLQDYLLNTLLKNGAQNYLYNVEIVDHKRFFNELIEEASPIEQYKILQDLKLDLFKNNQDDLVFLSEILEHYHDLNRYEVNFNDLAIEDELKMIFNALKKPNTSKFEAFLKNDNYNQYIIVEGAYDLFEEKVFEHMLKNGATSLKLEHFDNEITLTKALNERQELEMIAQYIITEDLDPEEITLQLCNSLNQNLVHSVFNRYHIPYLLAQDETAILAKRFIALLEFYLEPTLINYQNILKCNTFKMANLETFNYLKRHVRENSFLEPFERFKEEDRYYKHIEEEASIIHNATYPILIELLKLNDYKEALSFIYQKIQDSSKITKRIKSTLIEEPDYQNKAYFKLLKAALLKIKEEPKNTNGILIQKELLPTSRPYLFIVDASNNYYPNFNVKKGLINERLLKDTNYPSMQARLNQHLKNLDYIKHTKHTYFFVAETSFKGKDIILSSLIEEYPILKMDYVEIEEEHYPQHQLDPTLAQNLFLKDGVLRGSVSSLESFMQCPYRYFLNYGLKIKDPALYDFAANTTGTIIHAIFEELIQENGKNYYRVNEDQIETVLKPYKERFYNLYPNEQVKTDIVFGLFKKALIIEFDYLSKMEKTTSMKPLHTELEFKERVFDLPIELIGSIDRIDTFEDHFRIYDYKTSEHKISKISFEKGLQLQLLTYLFIYEQVSELKPEGAYYINANHPRLYEDYYAYSLSKGLVTNEVDDKKFIKAHSLQGTTFRVLENTDHIISGKKALDANLYYKALKEIYTYIYKEIESGNIKLEPYKDACKYCKYRPICRHIGGDFAKEPICSLGGE